MNPLILTHIYYNRLFLKVQKHNIFQMQVHVYHQYVKAKHFVPIFRQSTKALSCIRTCFSLKEKLTFINDINDS